MPDALDVRGLSAAFPLLRGLARRRVRGETRCELCGADIGERHAHLVGVDDQRLLCACQPCSLLFEETGSRRYRRVPRDVEALPALRIDDADWEALAVPINLAFFFFNSRAGRVAALYPSPAGVTESLLPLAAFEPMAAQSPRLVRLLPDVEALLANRLRLPHEYYVAPIDRCYELAGLIRAHWRGFSGGDELWSRVNDFFAVLRAETGVEARSHAEP